MSAQPKPLPLEAERGWNQHRLNAEALRWLEKAGWEEINSQDGMYVLALARWGLDRKVMQFRQDPDPVEMCRYLDRLSYHSDPQVVMGLLMTTEAGDPVPLDVELSQAESPEDAAVRVLEQILNVAVSRLAPRQ
jgi:hypothetical protein